MNVNSFAPVLIPICAIAVPIVMGVWQAARKRELEHIERMKALEMGRTLPGDSAWPGLVCIAIGGLVPVGALVVALIATLVPGPKTPMLDQGGTLVQVNHERGEGYYGLVWGGASVVGLAGVGGGTYLALRLFGRKPEPNAVPSPKMVQYDPDAYDTVSQRG